MRKTLGMIRKQGGEGTDAELYDRIKKAYWNKRAKLLAAEAMKKYES